MIRRLLGKRYSRVYDLLMANGSYDKATVVAYRKDLGEEKLTNSARKWYDQLLNERSPDIACAVAIRFNLPDSYVRYSMVEALRLRAHDIEEASYKFMQDAVELKAQAKEIENSTHPSNDYEKDGFKFEQADSCELRSKGERIVAHALESGYFFKDMKNGRRFGLETDVFYNIGLAIFENELMIGDKKHADLIARSYRIKDDDRKVITAAVKNRKEEKRIHVSQ